MKLIAARLEPSRFSGLSQAFKLATRPMLSHSLTYSRLTIQGTFHANPDYALWYGWSEMKQDLSGIKALAEELRRTHR